MSALRTILWVVGGALAGYAWYRVVGCRTGTCPITSNAWTSTGYGAVVGAMMAWGH